MLVYAFVVFRSQSPVLCVKANKILVSRMTRHIFYTLGTPDPSSSKLRRLGFSEKVQITTLKLAAVYVNQIWLTAWRDQTVCISVRHRN